MRRRCTWSIFQSIEYSGEQDQAKLRDFFSYLRDHFNPSSHEDRDFINCIISEEKPTRNFKMKECCLYESIDVPNSYTGPRLSFPLLPNQAAVLVEAFKCRQQLHARYLLNLLHETQQLLSRMPNINQVLTCYNGDVTVCGDLHGHLDDLFLIFYKNGLPSSERTYVFNGDFVDRGKDSVEILIILFAFMLAYPNAIYLNRGNHEDYLVNLRYGFTREVMGKYKKHGKGILTMLRSVFCLLPLATLIDKKVLVIHGGVSDQTDLDLLRGLKRDEFVSVMLSKRKRNVKRVKKRETTRGSVVVRGPSPPPARRSSTASSPVPPGSPEVGQPGRVPGSFLPRAHPGTPEVELSSSAPSSFLLPFHPGSPEAGQISSGSGSFLLAVQPLSPEAEQSASDRSFLSLMPSNSAVERQSTSGPSSFLSLVPSVAPEAEQAAAEPGDPRARCHPNSPTDGRPAGPLDGLPLDQDVIALRARESDERAQERCSRRTGCQGEEEPEKEEEEEEEAKEKEEAAAKPPVSQSESELETREQLETSQREWKQVIDILWSDPMVQCGCKANVVRGGGCYFGPDVTERLFRKYSLQLLIRSHECKDEGYEFCHDRKVLTVFSASNYYDDGSNWGAYIKLAPDLVPHIVQYRAHKATHLLTRRQRVNCVEEAALGALRLKLFSHSTELLRVFQTYDPETTGFISIQDWAAAVEMVLHLGLPWRLLRDRLLPAPVGNHLEYRPWLDTLVKEQPRHENVQPSLLEMLYRNRSNLETIFRIIDKDRSGVISFDEFKHTWKLFASHMNVEITDETISSLARSIDSNRDGNINIDEFLEAFRLVEQSFPRDKSHRTQQPEQQRRQ
ncbi:serine/threonine-protein phosphatase with EF-hands 2 [Tachyglossus aculeatus]|uniref:serine/threonine-protein phosphatase with EF-hands 2 n=1 Tax=Tachyglossus aculeatus TaxID=9261 RepID=UPI0018F5E6A3|nr:serine/threonine-protein phosphatase with EF-hands 2 [Tachyglossus aculeatus]